MVKAKGKIKDLRTKQILKLYRDGIKDRQPAMFVPDGVVNELMDLDYAGEVVGDVEIGSVGFIEIMFLVEGIGFVKLKRLPDEKNVGLMIV